MDAVELYPAADDGARPLLLRSRGRQVHRRSLPRRSREALRRHRRGADLGDLSEHGHRQPQSAGHGALHARRRRRRAADGRRLSSPRRAGAVPHHDVGPGHARSRQPLARCDGGVHEARSARTASTATRRTACRWRSRWLRTRSAIRSRSSRKAGPRDEALAWNVHDLGTVQVSVRSHGRPVSLAGDRATRSTSRAAGTATRPTTCSSPSSTAKVGRAGRMSGASGTASRRATPKPRAAWPRWSAASRRSWSARTGSRSIRRSSYGVFASRWPLGGRTVWTIVNRNEYDVRRAPDDRALPGRHALLRSLPRRRAQAGAAGDNSRAVAFRSRRTAIGMILATRRRTRCGDAAVDGTHEGDDRRSRSRSFSHEWKVLPQQQVADRRQQTRSHRRPKTWSGFPAADYVFRVQGIEIEGSDDVGVDVQIPVGRQPAPLPRAPHGAQAVLHRQISGDQRRVQEVSRCHALSPAETI